jgi:hypothetical protein
MHRRTFLGPQSPAHSTASPKELSERNITSSTAVRGNSPLSLELTKGPYLFQILGLEGEILSALLGRFWAVRVYLVGPCVDAAGGMRCKRVLYSIGPRLG